MRGDRLRQLRIRKELTQEELGKLLGVGKTTISQYESGARKPDGDMLSRMAGIFGVSVDYLLGRTDYPQPERKVPSWVEKLPPHLRDKLSDEDWNRVFIRTVNKMAMEDIPPEVLENVMDAIIQAKKRDEEAKKKGKNYTEENSNG